MKNKRRILIVVMLLVGLGLLFLPVKSNCRYPGDNCTTEPNATGKVLTFYENIPIGLYFLESLTKQDTGIHYTSGYDTSIVQDSTLIPLKQTVLQMGLATGKTTDVPIVLDTTKVNEVSVEPGQVVERDIEFSVNDGAFTTLRIYVFPFDITKEDCSIDLGSNSPNDAVQWLNFFVLSTPEEHAQGFGKIRMIAKVPEDAENKTYWGSINFSGEADTKVITLDSVQTLPVFVTVGGDSLSESCIGQII